MDAEGLSQRREAEGDMGGTMRLGAYEAVLAGNSHVHAIYGADRISERHRHRYEVNIHYKAALEQEGLLFTGMSQPAPDLIRGRAARDRRAAGSSVVRGGAVPSGAQEQAL